MVPMDGRTDFCAVAPVSFDEQMTSQFVPGLRQGRPESPVALVRGISWLWSAMVALSMATLTLLGFVSYYGFTPANFPVANFLLIAALAGLLAVLFLAWRRTLHTVTLAIDKLNRTAVLGQKAEAELHTLEIEYRDVFMGHPAPLWIFDLQNLRIVAVNDAAIVQYGYSREEFLQMTIKDLRPETGAAGLEGYLLSARPMHANAGIWKHRKKDGSLADVEVVSHELDWHGRKLRIVSATDITRRLAAERNLVALTASLENQVKERTEKARRYAHKLRERKLELEIANRDLEMFSYSASHDLKTPLAVVDIFATVLQEDFGEVLPPEARDCVQKIHAVTHGMSALVNDLMKLAKLSKHVVQKQTVNLSETAASVVALLQAQDPGRQVEVHIQQDVLVRADPGLLGIALENLIGNAWKYTAHAAKPRLSVGIKFNGSEKIVYVRDNGAGFDMQRADGLFKPFRRLHSNQEFEGTGIGLAIVQRVVALHEGCVWAYAEPGEGATFYFTLSPGTATVRPLPSADEDAAFTLPDAQHGLVLRPEGGYEPSDAELI